MKKFLMGNELIALAAYNAGVRSAYAYPGTPSSEILEYFIKISEDVYAQWSINEKIALELAGAEAISGKFVLCSMKQVGLNVAADPFFSIAYTGIKGALVIASADDPGPYSSQTEQDSRMYAMSAKLPVFDPINPEDAYFLTKKAVDLSHKYEITVMIRPVMRVCHSRQSIDVDIEKNNLIISNSFEKDTARWAATPKFRKQLHSILNQKLKDISNEYYKEFKINKKSDFAVVGSGYSFAMAMDIVAEDDLNIDLYKLDLPFPLPDELINSLLEEYEKILVIEETQPVIEMQFARRDKVFGRLNGFITNMGELTYQYLQSKLYQFLGKENEIEEFDVDVKSVKPRLCPGCGHRPAFYAIKKVAKNRGIFPGDIGCYTLGVNLEAVDTCICMGASVTFAEGLKRANNEKVVIATIGDSTFFHTGVPALINAVANDSKIVLAILDNETTAMTGFQPVPHNHKKISIERVVIGCGVDFCKTIDPYDFDGSIKLLNEAIEYSEKNNTPAVAIFKHPCVTKIKYKGKKRVVITDKCKNCKICYEKFECPAIFEDKFANAAKIDELLCVNCGVCISVCPFDAIAYIDEVDDEV